MMSLRTMIREIRSRPHRVIQDDSAADSDQRSWADMPEELLREVIARIEASEKSWPRRRSVVACAGVCSTWRRVTEEIVKTPELSRTITFPINLKQPGPRESLVQCFIKRDRSSQTYHLYLSLTNALVENGKYLLSARKSRRGTGTDYVISLHAEGTTKKHETFIGKLRANFFGSRFTILDAQPPHPGAKVTKSSSTRVGLRQISPRASVGSYSVAHISYDLNVLGARGPRKMQCVFDTIPSSAIKPGGIAPTPTEFPIRHLDRSPSIRFGRSKSSNIRTSPDNPKDGALVLKSKAPRWHDQLQCWCLNFHGRVTVASVKNFQLMPASQPEPTPSTTDDKDHIILQFGKVGKDLFTMDYRYPISAFQAFAVCLSSFASNVSCE
uniref:Tubby C-terminal domain-containing protein n=1 Tax=Kalanchoe fedtschenkoi TaxID=63787 RepID=A0A7N0U8S7_KALFE